MYILSSAIFGLVYSCWRRFCVCVFMSLSFVDLCLYIGVLFRMFVYISVCVKDVCIHVGVMLRCVYSCSCHFRIRVFMLVFL